MANIHKSFNGIKDPLIIADLYSEIIGGASNTACAIGNGRLSAGISPWGEVVYFRWPDPSKYDHLRYVTQYKSLLHGLFRVRNMRYGKNAPCGDWYKYGRPYEKYKGLGACGGLYSSLKGMAWQDQPCWTSSRRYSPEWSHLIETRLVQSGKDGMPDAEMIISQWVMPDDDVLVQHYSINAPAYDAFFYHAVFAPWMTSPASFHSADTKNAGWGAVFLNKEKIFLWMYPAKEDRKLLRKNIRRVSCINDIDDICAGKGIFIAMACSLPVQEFQAGADKTGRFIFKKWPVSGHADAKDGALKNRRRQKGPVDGAVKIPLTGGRGEITVIISIADSPGKAGELLRDVSLKGTEDIKKACMPLWKSTADRVYVPQGADSRLSSAARRSITNLLIGQDRDTGAIVASLTRQPRYCCDWPRDGVFFDMALDLAGLHDAVDRHLLFYKKAQRKERTAFSLARLASFKNPFFNPGGHWYPNINCDGSAGYLKIIPFEIDETSLMVWNIWRHCGYVPADRYDSYRDEFSGTVVRAMNAVMSFIDRKLKWIKTAIEDDDYVEHATFHGASALLTALASGADLARRWGLGASLGDEWLSAALILRRGMLERIHDPGIFDNTGWRGIQWSLFPAPLFDSSGDEESKPLVERLAADMRTKALGKNGGVGYLGEQLFTFALATAGLKEYDAFKEEVLNVLVNDVPVEGTGSYGELGIWIEYEGKKLIQNRTSIPHLWNGVTVYLSILAVREPGLFKALRPPLPLQ